MQRYPKQYGTEIIEFSQKELDKWAAVDDKTLDEYAAKLDKQGLPGTKIFWATRKLIDKYNK